LQRLAADTDSTSKTVSTLVRNAESTADIIAGAGLTGGGPLNSSSAVTLSVGQGTGILVGANTISLDTSALSGYVTGSGTDQRLLKWSGTGSVAGDSSIAEVGASGFVATFDTSMLTGDNTFYFVLPYGAGYVITGDGDPDRLALWGSAACGIDDHAAFSVDRTNQRFNLGDGTAGGPGLAFSASSTKTANITLSSAGLLLIDVPSSSGRLKVSGNVGSPTTNPVLEVIGRIKSVQADTQDAIALMGSGVGTSSYEMTLTPTTLTGSRTITFPNETMTVAGRNVAQTFVGNQTFNDTGPYEFGGTGSAADGVIVVTASTAKNAGIFFAPSGFTGTGQAIFANANTAPGAYFKSSTPSNVTPTITKIIGGVFESGIGSTLGSNIDDVWGAWLRPNSTTPLGNSGRTTARIGGFKVFAAQIGKNSGTFTDLFGGYVSDMSATTTGASNFTLNNSYGIYIEQQTRAATINNGIFLALTSGTTYKAIAIRDQNAWVGSAAAGEITIGGTNFRCTSTNQGVFGVAAIARPTNAIAAAAFAANTSGIVNDTATWGGYTMGQVVQALQNYGVLT
jgi:hypothetical protein